MSNTYDGLNLHWYTVHNQVTSFQALSESGTCTKKVVFPKHIRNLWKQFHYFCVNTRLPRPARQTKCQVRLYVAPDTLGRSKSRAIASCDLANICVELQNAERNVPSHSSQFCGLQCSRNGHRLVIRPTTHRLRSNISSHVSEFHVHTQLPRPNYTLKLWPQVGHIFPGYEICWAHLRPNTWDGEGNMSWLQNLNNDQTIEFEFGVYTLIINCK